MAPSTINIRPVEAQLPSKRLDIDIVKSIYEHFKDKPTAFERCAADLAMMMDDNIFVDVITRPSVDGGRDAVGRYKLGPLSDPIRRLTAQGFRSPQSREMLPNTVRIICLRHRIFLQRHQSHPRRIPGYLTVPQLTQAWGLSPHWIYDRIYTGTIEVTKDPRRKTFLFPDAPTTLEQFRRLKEGSLTKLAF